MSFFGSEPAFLKSAKQRLRHTRFLLRVESDLNGGIAIVLGRLDDAGACYRRPR